MCIKRWSVYFPPLSPLYLSILPLSHTHSHPLFSNMVRQTISEISCKKLTARQPDIHTWTISPKHNSITLTYSRAMSCDTDIEISCPVCISSTYCSQFCFCKVDSASGIIFKKRVEATLSFLSVRIVKMLPMLR